MKRLAVVSACVLVIVGCSDRTSQPNSDSGSNQPAPSALEQTIAARVADCIAKGATRANCDCRAETSARYLSFDDFAEETRLLRSGDRSALDRFQRRMFAEQKNKMFQLGQALADCPMMRIETE